MHTVEQRTEAPASGAPSPQEPQQLRAEAIDTVLRSPGQPLADDLRHSMETAFGIDLSDVRLHSDAAAESSAADVGARAYTVGEHVVLGRDARDNANRPTLVHELAHVAQQRGSAATSEPLPVSRPGDPSERAADAAAHGFRDNCRHLAEVPAMFAPLLTRPEANPAAPATYNRSRQRVSLIPPRLGVSNQALLRAAHESLSDPLEREADQLAEHAVSALPQTAVGGIPPGIQRFSGQPTGSAAAMPASVGHVLAGPGRPLEPTLRQDMEYRLGHDFSGVRVHVSAAAEQSARDLNAHAYTVGNNIVFGPGQFAPATQHGRRLLAHELTHVAQQSQFGGEGKVVQREGELSSLPPLVLSLLNNMDVQGEMILGTYLYGGGKRHDVEDPIWTAYMMENRSLRLQILARLMPAVREIVGRQKTGRYPLAETFHGECHQNNGFSGYALLHGSNKDVGDFQLLGWADVEEAVDPAEGSWDIELNLRFVFNDIVDPNTNYWSDRVRSVAANIASIGRAQSYHLSIHWSSRCLAEVRGQQIVYSGYPADHPRVVRPLPRAKLDVADLEKKRAKGIESEIIKELQQSIAAGDVESLAGRKERLLWLFYRLSGYWGSTYLDRISNATPDDALPRLLRNRVSSRLRAELMEALRGKRPQGDAPL